MKRNVVLCLLVALALLIAAMPTAALAEEPVELTIVVSRATADTFDHFSDKHWVTDAEEATGIHVNWIEFTDGQYSETLATMLAGDLPDVFFMPLNDSIIVQNTSLFVPLENLLEENAPYIYNLYEENIPNWREFITYPDGHIYSLMSGAVASDQHKVDGTQFINTKWLENLGLEMPTNLDELYDVLVAFRDEDADLDGDTDDEIPIDFCNAHWSANITNFAQMWGLPISSSVFYMWNDDEVVGAVDTDEFRAFLEYFYMLGQEGLLNLEGFSQTNEQYYANLDGINVGTFFGWAPYTFINSDQKLEYDSVTPMAAEGYVPMVRANNANRANRNGYTITTACKNVEAALKYYDYISNQDFARYVYRGEENLMWKMKDGKMISKVATKEELLANGYESLADSTNDTTIMNSIGYNNYYPLLLDFLSADLDDKTENIAVRIISVNKVLPYLSKTMSQAIVTAEQNEALSFATDGLKTVVNAFIADSILNGVTDESWDAYLADLEAHGYSFYVEWYNNYYHNAL